jgi:peptide subunit release factor RF-3
VKSKGGVFVANTLSSIDREAFIAEIGKNIYIDVAKWHLYLAEAHLDTALAERLTPLLFGSTIDEQGVMQVLSAMQVSVGGGKRELPLSDLMPMQSQVNLIDLLEDFQKRL